MPFASYHFENYNIDILILYWAIPDIVDGPIKSIADPVFRGTTYPPSRSLQRDAMLTLSVQSRTSCRRAGYAAPRATMPSRFSALWLAVVLGAAGAGAVTRTRYLSAEEVAWDYAPSRENLCTARAAGAATDDGVHAAADGPSPAGVVYTKALFREYAAGDFESALDHPEHLGTLGPMLHVEVGDVLRVVLRHNAEQFGMINFAPDHVVARPGNAERVSYGEVGTWEFDVREAAGPAEDAYSSSVMHYYTSSVDKSGALYAGLFGPLVVTRRGEADAETGRPMDVDDELVTVLFVSNEDASPYADINRARDARGGSESGEDENKMNCINGRIYCNLNGLDMALGVTTRWYAAAIGNEDDLHTLHWHGNVGMSSDGLHADSVRLMSHSVLPVTFTPRNPGVYLLHCHIGVHQDGGMMALYNVAGDPVASGLESGNPTRVRHYFVQAEDEIWDYTPQGLNGCSGTAFGEDENIFVKESFPIEGDDGEVAGYGMGSKYLKTRYVQYTDETFTTQVERDSADSYLGLMGPILRVRVGEAMKIHFRNGGAEELTMHTHGLFYAKDSEGAPYNDGTSGKDKFDDYVPPGGQVEMLWVSSSFPIAAAARCAESWKDGIPGATDGN